MDNLDYIKPSQRNRQKRRDKRLYEELIECRRGNGGDRSKKLREKGELRKLQNRILNDTLEYRSSYRAKRTDTYQNDNLEPLTRFLESNKGRDWNEVFSELIQQLDMRSATGLHVVQHLWDFVSVNTKRENGKLVFYNQWGGTRQRYWSNWFYVDPDTNLLHSLRNKKQKGPFPKKARWKKEKQKNKLKRKLGIVDKPKTIFNFPQIKTYQQKLIVGRIYDYKSDLFSARILLKNIDLGNTLDLSVKVIKSEVAKVGEELTLSNVERSEYKQINGVWGWQKYSADWGIFDAGELSFHAVRWPKKVVIFSC